jgi:D-aspartate ligase
MIPAIVLGLSPTGLYAVRELGRAGIPVLGVAAQDQAGAWSRHLTHSDRKIIAADPSRRLAQLLALADRHPERPVLIPCSDQDIAFVTEHADTLKTGFRFQQSYMNGAADTLLSKADFYALCREVDIIVPSQWQGTRDEIAALADEIAFPCLIKPSLIHEVKDFMAGRKVWTIADRAEFDRILARLPTGDMIWLVQEIIPGPESEITLFCAWFDAFSRPHQAFTARKLRQYPPGFGSASLVQSHPEEETQEQSTRLMKHLGYQGIAATEFKRDFRDGKLKVIESNPRPSLWFSVSTAAGKQVALAAYQDLAGLDISLADDPQQQGVRWHYGLKDAYSALFYRLNPNFILPAPDLSEIPAPTSRTWAVAGFNDPGPALGEMINFARKGWRRMIR